MVHDLQSQFLALVPIPDIQFAVCHEVFWSHVRKRRLYSGQSRISLFYHLSVYPSILRVRPKVVTTATSCVQDNCQVQHYVQYYFVPV